MKFPGIDAIQERERRELHNEVHTSAASVLLSRPLATEEIIRRQRQYLEGIQPFVKMKTNIIGMQNKRYHLVEGKLCEPEIMWSPGSEEIVAQIDQCIEEIGRTIFQTR